MGLVEEAQALEAKWEKAKTWIDKAKADRDWLENEIDRLNEMLAAREALLDSANTREELLKSENARHMREKQELIGKLRRIGDATEEAMDHVTQIRMTDEAPRNELSPKQAEELLRELAAPKARGLKELVADQIAIPTALVRS